MEIRDLRLVQDDKFICTFTIYIPEWHLSLVASLKRGKKPGSEYIAAYAKPFEVEGDKTHWQPHWDFEKSVQDKLMTSVKLLLKDAMNGDQMERPKPGFQHNVPL